MSLSMQINQSADLLIPAYSFLQASINILFIHRVMFQLHAMKIYLVVHSSALCLGLSSFSQKKHFKESLSSFTETTEVLKSCH